MYFMFNNLIFKKMKQEKETVKDLQQQKFEQHVEAGKDALFADRKIMPAVPWAEDVWNAVIRSVFMVLLILKIFRIDKIVLN